MRLEPSVRLLAALAGLLAVSLCAAPAKAQADAAHPMSAAQTIAPADLAPDEVAFYQTLDPSAAHDFLVTRSWYRLCRQVVEHRLPAAQLPDKPAGFSVKYLQPTDPNYINRALGMQLGGDAPGGAAEMTAAQLLQPAAFSPAEQAVWSGLTDTDHRRMFIATRSYLRLCRKVLDHSMPAADLPLKPLDYYPHYISPDEKAQIGQAVTASIVALAK